MDGDILTTKTADGVFELVFKGGDLVIGDASEQHVANVLEANKGNFRRRPTLGADLHNLLDSPANPIVTENVIKNELLKDGYSLEELEISDNKIEIKKVNLTKKRNVL